MTSGGGFHVEEMEMCRMALTHKGISLDEMFG